MSGLDQSLADYLQLRRSLGHQLADAARLLPRFVAWLDTHETSTVTVAAAVAWAQESGADSGGTAGSRRMMAVRGFARYLSGIDPDTEIPPTGLMPSRQRRRPPFLYSPADIDRIIAQATTSIVPPLRAATYATLIGLLAASGLRIGEAIKLDRGDIDWEQGVLLIRETKFGKTRLVPLHETSMRALTAYAALRDAHRSEPVQPSFFVARDGQRLCYTVVSTTFRRLVDDSGVGAGAPFPPRLHDLRHVFAVRALLGWYRTGQDVQARIPSLSTYLGHREPASTYWYLSAAPELLAAAATRQHTAWLEVRA